MSIMKAIIVDDEKSGRETLQRLIEDNCKGYQQSTFNKLIEEIGIF